MLNFLVFILFHLLFLIQFRSCKVFIMHMVFFLAVNMRFLHSAKVSLFLEKEWVLFNEHFVFLKLSLVHNWDRLVLISKFSSIKVTIRMIVICSMELAFLVVITSTPFWPSWSRYLNAAKPLFFHVSHHRTIRLFLLLWWVKMLGLINRAFLVLYTWSIWHSRALESHSWLSASISIGLLWLYFHWFKLVSWVTTSVFILLNLYIIIFYWSPYLRFLYIFHVI